MATNMWIKHVFSIINILTPDPKKDAKKNKAWGSQHLLPDPANVIVLKNNA